MQFPMRMGGLAVIVHRHFLTWECQHRLLSNTTTYLSRRESTTERPQHHCDRSYGKGQARNMAEQTCTSGRACGQTHAGPIVSLGRHEGHVRVGARTQNTRTHARTHTGTPSNIHGQLEGRAGLVEHSHVAAQGGAPAVLEGNLARGADPEWRVARNGEQMGNARMHAFKRRPARGEASVRRTQNSVRLREQKHGNSACAY